MEFVSTLFNFSALLNILKFGKYYMLDNIGIFLKIQTVDFSGIGYYINIIFN